jgi:hypothetical protein
MFSDGCSSRLRRDLRNRSRLLPSKQRWRSPNIDSLESHTVLPPDLDKPISLECQRVMQLNGVDIHSYVAIRFPRLSPFTEGEELS